MNETRLTYPMLASFFTEVRGIVGGGARNVVLDLATVAYIDSAAIGCVMDIGRRLEDRGGALRLTGIQRRVATMLSIAGVHRLLDLCPAEDRALGAAGKRRNSHQPRVWGG